MRRKEKARQKNIVKDTTEEEANKQQHKRSETSKNKNIVTKTTQQTQMSVIIKYR